MISSDMYQENILDHFKNPRNKGALKNPSVKASEVNPLCGDNMIIELSLDKEIIKDVRFNGNGCAISQASASILSEHIKGRTASYILKMGRDELLNLLGVNVTAARLKCAMLSLNTIKKALLTV